MGWREGNMDCRLYKVKPPFPLGVLAQGLCIPNPSLPSILPFLPSTYAITLKSGF
jgi:hypothetical protein